MSDTAKYLGLMVSGALLATVALVVDAPDLQEAILTAAFIWGLILAGIGLLGLSG